MKKQPLFLGILGLSTLLGLTGFAQKAQESKTLEERVQQLEAQIEAMQANMEGMNESSQAEAGALDAITGYLQLQAKASEKMVSTLKQAESLGFVAGINFPSREALLAGWREQLSAAQKSVPGVVVKVEDKGRKGWRR